ncbi:MAG: hypothetical protein LIO79_09400 [Rikenellaceae bacterium]|nr:hypothetical protein [Rikenellaceae bacterium]
MQGFIKLTTVDGDIYLNVDHIVAFSDYEDGSIVYLAHAVKGGINKILVSEEMEYINNLIETSPID